MKIQNLDLWVAYSVRIQLGGHCGRAVAEAGTIYGMLNVWHA